MCTTEYAEEGVVVLLVFRWGQIRWEDISGPAVDNEAGGYGRLRLWFVVHF